MSRLAKLYIETAQRESASPRHSLAMFCYAFAAMAPLPLTRMENPEFAFHTTVRPRMNAVLNEVNEQAPIRIAEAQDLIKKLWVLRYRACHPSVNSYNIGICLTKEQLPEIYLDALGALVDQDTGMLNTNTNYLEAALMDWKGE